MDQQQSQTKWAQFSSLIIVFFFWGFVAASNDILIPVFKKWFVLTQLQSQLVAWAFYAAYFIGSVIFFVISLKTDIIQYFGYKKTLATGLSISAIGAFLFYPAAATANFWFFLVALFIVGLGFSIQQIVANPLAIKMGSPNTGAHRLTLAGGINSLGTTIGPIILGIILFGTSDKSEPIPTNLTKIEAIQHEYITLRKELEKNVIKLNSDTTDSVEDKNETLKKVNVELTALDFSLNKIETISKDDDSQVDDLSKKLDVIKKNAANINYPKNFVKSHLSMVKFPFIILGIAFLLVAIFMLFSKIEDPSKIENEETKSTSEPFNIRKYPQLLLGMVAIFLYVGVEVSIISNLPALLHTREFGSILENNIAPFVSLYWGSLMIGRWNGGINVFNTSKTSSILLRIIVPFLVFGIILLANHISGKDVTAFYIYPIWIIMFLIMSFIGGKNAGKSLVVFSAAGFMMMLIGMIYPDKEIAKYFFISGGLFCSIMWPAIFDLAIAGLGKNIGKASSFLVMMILGGGIVPLVQGWICDFDAKDMGSNGILGLSYTHFSYIIPAVCFLYLGIYGYITPKIIKKQGISLNEDTSNTPH